MSKTTSYSQSNALVVVEARMRFTRLKSELLFSPHSKTKMARVPKIINNVRQFTFSLKKRISYTFTTTYERKLLYVCITPLIVVYLSSCQ